MQNPVSTPGGDIMSSSTAGGSSSSPTFMFEGPDGVNMDGLLSDSNDSSSSSMTDIGPGVSLNMLTSHGSNNTNGHHHHLHSHQQNHHLLHTTNGQQQLNHHNNNLMNDQLYYTSSHQHLQPQHQQSQQHSQQHHQQVQDHSNGSNKRKIVDGEASTSKSTTETSKKKTSPPNGKKTKGRVKIKMEFIDNKLRRYTTFSKRKTGIMKKAYELSTLTGTQVMLLVASETGHVYTFATRKLQPMITSDAGKALIQTCLNSPDSVMSSSTGNTRGDDGVQRMCATGFEETDLTYTVNENDNSSEKSPSNNNGFLSIPTLFLEAGGGGGSSGPGNFIISNTNHDHHQQLHQHQASSSSGSSLTT